MPSHDPFADCPSAARRGVRKPKPEAKRPDPPPFNQQQTRRWLEHVKRDDWWQSQMPIPPTRLCLALGWPRNHLFYALNGEQKGVNLRTVLPKVACLIPAIESRNLCFPRMHLGWVKEGSERQCPPEFLWLEPPGYLPHLPKLSKESAWSLWARCATCGNNQFLPIAMNAEPHIACYHCLPPDQHASIGARAEKRSLIHEALKKYY